MKLAQATKRGLEKELFSEFKAALKLGIKLIKKGNKK
jgi:hypothetical protein